MMALHYLGLNDPAAAEPWLTPEQRALRAEIRAFVDREIRPRAGEHDRSGRIPDGLLRDCAALGLGGMAIPEEYGGQGAGEVGLCLLAEEVGRVDGSLRAVLCAHASIGTHGLLLAGSEEQKRRYLPRLASMELLAAFALTEAGAGSDAASIRTRAVRDGDGWVLDGEKAWITGGDRADLLTVFAVTDPGGGAREGITAFLVERGFGGVTSGPPERKLGLHASGTTTVAFRGTRVPAANILGEVGGGFRVAMRVLEHGRLSMGASALGMAKEALDLSLAYAGQREQFGKPIAEHQAIATYLAEMATRIYAMELLVHHAVSLAGRGERIGTCGSMVKLFCTEQCCWIVDRAVQIHGAMGYSGDLPVERLYRDARVMPIWEGTSEIQRLVIARSLTRKPG